MFVSLLQLMGFPATKPVHSRAEQKAPVRPESGAEAPQEQPDRRSPMKASSRSSKKVAGKPAKAVKTVKPVRVVKGKTPAKSSPATGKTKASPAASKATPTSVGKVMGKAAAKASSAKPVPGKAKAPSSKIQPTRAAVKSAAKPATKAVAKPVAAVKIPVNRKPVTSTPVKKQTVAAAAKSVKSAAPHQKSKTVTRVVETQVIAPKKVPVKKAPAAPVAAPSIAAVVPPSDAALDMPVRSARPSSRLVQLTVPSIAQSVASTAAKASFTKLAPKSHVGPGQAVHVKKDPKLANNWKKKAVADLSDEEVIAMSDQDYMNDTQMAFFRLKLVALKNAILNNAGETTEHLREDTVVVPDPADRATIEEEHALELRTRDRERKLLKKIEQSINRIDAGDYGYCDETGEPIGVARLLARPTATLSLEAQQRRELKQKMFGD